MIRNPQYYLLEGYPPYCSDWLVLNGRLSLIPFLLIGIEQKSIHDTFPIDQRATPDYFPPQLMSSMFK